MPVTIFKSLIVTMPEVTIYLTMMLLTLSDHSLSIHLLAFNILVYKFQPCCYVNCCFGDLIDISEETKQYY